MTRHGAITRIDPKGWGLIADGHDTRWFGAQGLSGGSLASLSVGDSVTFDLQPNPRPEKREQCPLVATNVKASTHALVRRGQSSHPEMKLSLSTQGLEHLGSKGNCETLKRVEEKKIHRADGSFMIERTEVTRVVFQPYGKHAWQDGKWGLLRIKHSGKVLDVSGGSQEDGACIHQWTKHGGDNQLFKFEVT